MGLFDNLFGKKDQSAARAAAGNIALQNFNLTGPGGFSVGFTPTGGNVALGTLDPIRAMLLGNVSANLSGIPGLSGLSAAADTASNALTGPVIDPSFMSVLSNLVAQNVGSGVAPSLAGGRAVPPQLQAVLAQLLNPQTASTAGLSSAVNDVRSFRGLDPALAQQFAAAGADRLATAGATADQVAADRLSLLRQQAEPFEQEFVRKSIGDLFAKGRFGSQDSLSGKVGEGVARALSGADLARQVEAQNLGRAIQADAVSQAGALTDVGRALTGDRMAQVLSSLQAEGSLFGAQAQNLSQQQQTALQAAGLGNVMLGDEFSRALAGFNAQQSAQSNEINRFLPLLQAASGMSDASANRALQRFGIAQQLFDTSLSAEDSAMQRALASLGGAQGIDAQGMQAFMQALQGSVARSNASSNQASAFLGLAQNTPLLDFGSALLGSFSFGK